MKHSEWWGVSTIAAQTEGRIMKQGTPGKSTPTNAGATAAPSATPAGGKKRTTAKPTVEQELKPTIEQIRRRAYEIYLERQGKGAVGSPDSDWVQAERDLARNQNRR
jgi:hypothetical protein